MAPAGDGSPRVVEITEPIEHPIELAPGITMSMVAVGSLGAITMNGVELTRGGGGAFTVSDASSVYGRAASQPNAAEDWSISLPPGVYAVEVRLHEPTVPAQCGNPDCFDTIYRVEAFHDGAVIHAIDYAPYDDRDNVLRLWSDTPIERVALRATFNNTDDEFLGDIRIGRDALPASYPSRLPAPAATAIGRALAVHDDQLLIGHQAGVVALRRAADGTWQPQGGIAQAGAVDHVAVDDRFAAWSIGQTVHLRAHGPGDAATWEAFAPLPLSVAPADLALGSGVLAIGTNGLDRVLLFSFDQATNAWTTLPDLVPANPIPGTDSFGRHIGIDDDLLVVGASRDGWYLYQRAGASGFTEVHRHTLLNGLGPTQVSIGDGVVANQLFGGTIAHLHFRDTAGNWGYRTFVSRPQLAGELFSSAWGVSVDASGVLMLSSFTSPASPESRFILAAFEREADDRWTRVGLFVDPLLDGAQSPLLGSLGRAFAIEDGALFAGQPNPDRCDVSTPPALGEGLACPAIRSGAVFATTLESMGAIFSDGIEAAAP